MEELFKMYKELETLLSKNKWNEAIIFISKLHSPLPNELADKLGWCYSRMERYVDAIKIYKDLVKRAPEQASYYYALGYQYYVQKKYKMAIQYFEEALILNKNYFIVRYRVAYSYLQLSGTHMQFTKSEFWKAISHFQECHHIFKKLDENQTHGNKKTYSRICFAHGRALMSSKLHVNKCIELLSSALELDKDNIDICYNLSLAYFNNDEFEKASEILKNLSYAGKIKYYVRELEAQINVALNNPSKAVSILSELAKTRKKDYIYRRLAECFLEMKNIEKALEFSIKSIEIGKENYKNFLTCAHVYKFKKQYKTAISFLQQARSKKQEKYKQDCPEAIREIETILLELDTANDTVKQSSAKIIFIPERKTGTITKWNFERGFGFIINSETNDEYFIHIRQYSKGIEPFIGQKVQFDTEQSQKGVHAINVSVLG